MIIFLTIVVVVVYFCYRAVKLNNHRKDSMALKEYFNFEKYALGSVLVVNEKSAFGADNLSLYAYREIFVKDVPDRIVYTGATVGGITTGGFHVQKGGTAYTYGDKTGKYSLCYKYAEMVDSQPYSHVVSFLQLSDELMTEARRHPVMKKLILSDNQVKQVNALYHTEGKKNLISLLTLDEETAKAVKAWLGEEKDLPVKGVLKEFSNESGCYCAFTDEGILCKNSVKHRFYPYGSIDKIEFSLGSLGIEGKINKKKTAFIYVPANTDQKRQIEKLIAFANNKRKSAPRVEAYEIT